MPEFKTTPGPWRWELNKKSKSLQLCGHGEYGPYDFTVMDFERWGINGAVPRFRDENDLMVKAFEFGEIVPNRQHHREWFQSISHPDAKLIAASPDLLEACHAAPIELEMLVPGVDVKVIDQLTNAINKAIS